MDVGHPSHAYLYLQYNSGEYPPMIQTPHQLAIYRACTKIAGKPGDPQTSLSLLETPHQLALNAPNVLM